MNIYEVQPIFSHPTHPFELTIDAPGSKSITNRALMLAALANGETLLKGALFSHAGLCQRCLASGCFRTDEEASHGCPFKHFNRSGLPH